MTARVLIPLLIAFVVTATGAAPQHEETFGAILESEEAMGVTTVIQCFCGTCVNQTLHDCTCGTAARERQRVKDRLEGGETPDEIVQAYIEEHGSQVRIVPERTGLNFVGWIVPFLGSVAGLLILTFVLLAWTRRTVPHPARGVPVDMSGDPDGKLRARLARDLEEFERW